MKELRVTGSNASDPSAWRTALRLLGDGSVRTAPLISDVYSLADWERAFSRFKLLLDPWNHATRR
jgi:threonine dehydrogenase-like Zn-dependent dehydrogenase